MKQILVLIPFFIKCSSRFETKILKLSIVKIFVIENGKVQIEKMRAIPVLFLMLFTFTIGYSQSIYLKGSRIGEIESDGDIYINGSRVGEIESDGDVYLKGSRIGKIESDGDVYLNGSRIGKIESDGDIYLNGSRIGEVEEDGDIYYKGSRIGQAKGVKREWAAAVFFFFDFGVKEKIF